MSREQKREVEPQEQWYVMRAYKSEKKAEELLSGDHGLTYFIPKRKAIFTSGGKKYVRQVPVIHSLIFVRATQQEIVAFKKDIYNSLQFVTWKCNDKLLYLTVPDDQMNSFIEVCEQQDREVTFHRPDEIQLKKGEKVRVHGGAFNTMEGYFVKMAHKRSKQFVVIIPDILAASIEVEPEYIEIIR